MGKLFGSLTASLEFTFRGNLDSDQRKTEEMMPWSDISEIEASSIFLR